MRRLLFAAVRSGCYAEAQFATCSILGRATLFSMKTFSRIAFLGSLLLAPVLLHAQDSCVDSPECPTAILGVVGAAGAALYVRWKSR